MFSRVIDGAVEIQELSADRGVWFERDLVEGSGDVFGRTMNREFQEPGFQFQIAATFDLYMSVPLMVLVAGSCSSASAVADRVAADL